MKADRLRLPSLDSVALRDEVVQEQVADAFDRHLSNAPPVTLALVIACAVLHLATGALDALIAGWSPLGILMDERSAVTLVVFGAREHGLVQAGETWRLLSCVFLHGGPLHLALNMAALFGLGRILEATWGRARFLALFLGAGLAGSVLSQAFGTGMSVGASGGVFGLLGAGVVFGLRNRDALPRHLRKVFGKGLLPWVGVNLFIGFVVPRIDNLGHIGGLLGGALLALLLQDRVLPWRSPPRWAGWVLTVGSLAALAWAGWGVAESLTWLATGS